MFEPMFLAKCRRGYSCMSRRLARTLGLLALGGFIAGASPVPAPRKVFGLELGKPISLAQCARTRLPDGSFSQYTFDESDPAATCYEPATPLSDAPWSRGAIAFPLKRVPLIMHGNVGYTLVVDGKLEGIQIDTLSYGNTAGIIRELTSKFGRPTSVQKTSSTIEGISVPCVEAEWHLPDVHVDYISVDTDVDHGELWIETTKLHRMKAANDASSERLQTRL